MPKFQYEEVRKKWGDQAAEAARLHILSDLKMEGWEPEQHPFPRNQTHFREMDLW